MADRLIPRHVLMIRRRGGPPAGLAIEVARVVDDKTGEVTDACDEAIAKARDRGYFKGRWWSKFGTNEYRLGETEVMVPWESVYDFYWQPDVSPAEGPD